ncbi:MAG: hypothetical protein OXF49_00405 [Candidatus Saccharibacteria bacterium]|nr:hypothetical protein [Candidatus Saccharibacteria bacterium]
MKRKTRSTTQVIHLSVEADIVEVISQINAHKANKLVLVIPAQSVIFSKPFSLRLLANLNQSLNSELILITNNPSTRSLAEHYNLTVFDSLDHLDDLKTEDSSQSQSEAGISPNNLSTTEISSDSGRSFSTRLIKVLKTRLFKLSTLVGVIIFGVFLLYYLTPQTAEINIKTALTDLSINVQADLSLDIQKPNIENRQLPLMMLSTAQTYTYDISTSGQTSGAKASGVIEIYNCHPSNELLINGQTIFRRNGLDFVLQSEDLEFSIPASADIRNCRAFASGINLNHRSVQIEAVSPGEDYNLATGSYSIIGYNPDHYNVRGLDLAGGQSTRSCVTASDLERAKEDFIQSRTHHQARDDLINLLQNNNLIPLPETFQQANDDMIEPDLCPQISNNQLHQVVVYYMGGIRSTDLAKLIRPELENKAQDLQIIDDGLTQSSTILEAVIPLGAGTAEPTVIEAANYDYDIIIQISQAQAGVILYEDEILEQSVGKLAKQLAANLRRQDGVASVEIKLSPAWAFWIDRLPEKIDDISVNIDNEN